MINKNLILAALGSLALQNAVAQSTSHLNLSDAKPKPSEKISVTYDPAGTPLAGESELSGVVYFLDNKDYPVADLDLKPSGKQLKGEFTVPANAKAFFVKIFKDDKTDDNSEKGYTYYVYNGKEPVEGAYASKAYMLQSGMGEAFAKIKINKEEAASLYQKEFTAHPGAEKEYRSNYYNLLQINKTPESAKLLASKIAALEKSHDEKDLVAAYNFYARSGKKAKADSLSGIIKTKFPAGELSQNELGMTFNREQDLKKKEALYNDYIAKYPEKADDKYSIQDNLRLQLAMAYLKAGDIPGFEKWAAQVKSNKAGLANTLNSAAWKWAESGTRLDEAANISKKSMDIMSDQMKNPEASRFSSPKMVARNAQNSYDMYADTYAYILYKQGKFKEAIAYQQPVFERSKGLDADVAEHYALMLKGAGDTKQAQQVLEQAMKNGKASAAMTDLLKEAYIKNKGTANGFDNYLASLKEASAAATKAKLAKQMISQPAPAFALKDFDGNTVSLASLKGKVVIVDFWATWCGPCKASFPGMQMAVNKYQNNPNVKFLFIDTWENGDNYTDGVKKFIADNKYSFHVLMDEKGSDGRQSKVVSSFGVTGIPTKFVIDGAGAIRFKHVGYSGSDAAVLDEISAMIDMTLNPDAVTNAAKVTKLEE